MGNFHTHARFANSFDGARIAYSISGTGPSVILLPSWLTHLEHQWRSVAWRPWLEELGSNYQLVRYDPRGCGLSDRSLADLSFDTWVRDVEAVVEAAGLDKFALIGICQGGAVAVAYAGRAPERVSHLVLCGAYARGRNRRSDIPLEPDKAKLMLEMLRVGWGEMDHAFMRSFATQFQPEGTIDHLKSWCELQAAATSAENAVVLTSIMFDIDIQDAAKRIACPTLVAHANRDAVVPFEEGRLLAQLIPGARLLQLDTPNHFMMAHEPAWAILRQALTEFLPQPRDREGAFGELTDRERDVLEFLARGLDNHQIGAHLGISDKTVRNYVSAIFAKLGADTRAQAVVVARDAGFGMTPR